MNAKAKPTAAAPAKGNEVAEVKKNEVAVADEMDFAADAGMGTEGVDKDSQAIPFLVVLQSNSPAVVDNNPPGVRAGLLMNSVTGETFEKLVVVPVSFQRRFVEWAPRKLGGGYKGEKMPAEVEGGAYGYKAADSVSSYFVAPEGDKPLGREAAKDAHNALKDTRSHFIMAVKPDGTFFPALFPLASTQIKKSKKWISMILGVQLRDGQDRLYNPASFSHMYTIGTVKESNAEGQWFGVTVEAAGPVKSKEIYAAAKELHAQVAAGKVNVAQPDANVGGADGDAPEGSF
jgi:hypothetical protein